MKTTDRFFFSFLLMVVDVCPMEEHPDERSKTADDQSYTYIYKREREKK